MAGTLYITGDEAADELLNTDPNALLLGMLLDQQVPMEWAFNGPHTLKDRLGHLDPPKIAAMDVDEFVSICCEKPAIHRFPGSMGKRIHQVCTALVEDYDGNAANIWSRCRIGQRGLQAAQGAPRLSATRSRRSSWRSSARRRASSPTAGATAAGKFGDDVPRSVADVHDEVSLGKVREWKQAQKAAKKDKQDRPVD